jgi:uncharacterized membrane protein
MKLSRSILAVCLFLSSFAGAQVVYNVTPFQNPGATVTRAFGLNNHGGIVGTDDHTPGRHAFLVQSGTYLPLDPNGTLGTHTSFARGMNNRGDIVGAYFGDDGNQHGFLLRNGALTTLDVPFDGSIGTQANDINPSGVIVGAWVDGAFTVHGFVYQEGVYAHLDYPGALDTYPFGIDPQGDVAGNWDTDQSTVGHGFVFRKGQFTSFDVPEAVPEGTAANGINARGQIVGGYDGVDGSGHGFVTDGINFTTVDCPGASTTTVWAINSAGQLAGTCDVAGQRLGFVANPPLVNKP